MSECTHDCSTCSSKCEEQDLHEPANSYSAIKQVVAVSSGKGGVGKSSVTAMLAVLMARRGYKVGVLDADITGPSIPKAFGITQKARANDLGILPAETHMGIKVMSVNLLLEDPAQPVVWRGPVLAGAVKQFWSDVVWGELDVLFIDMPPEEVDVNVHPAKNEVRFRDEQTVFAAVLRAVGSALAGVPLASERFAERADAPAVQEKERPVRPLGFWGEADAVRVMPKQKTPPRESFDFQDDGPAGLRERSMPERDFVTGRPNKSFAVPHPSSASVPPLPVHQEPEDAEPFAGPSESQASEAQPAPSAPVATPAESKESAPEIKAAPKPLDLPLPDARPEQSADVSPLRGFRYLGQVARTYLVLSQNDDTLLILDQHAMHERIFYEKFRNGGSRGVAQPLLVPLKLDLHPAETERLLEIRDNLLRLGFETSCRGNQCLVQTMPPEMDRAEASAFLREALSGRVDDLESVWIHHACATAIRAGQHLTPDDAMHLIRQWLRTESPDFCPHGRPCAVTLEKADLEKLFKRRQS